MGFYPININISGKKCLVAGGGEVALRKVKHLIQAGARVILVAPKTNSSLKKLARSNKRKNPALKGEVSSRRGKVYSNVAFHPQAKARGISSLGGSASGGQGDFPIKIKQRVFKEGDLRGIFLAIAATDNFKTNKEISRLARERNILVNAADQPAECSFFIPAVLQKGDLSISISTNGKSPALSKKIKEELEKSIPKDIAELISKINILRKIQTKKLTESERQKFWNKFFEFNLLKDLKTGCKILKKKIKKCL